MNIARMTPCHVGRALALAVLVALQLPAHAALEVYFGLDNVDLSGGGAHPLADAAQARFAAAAGPLAQQSFEAADGITPGPVPDSFAVGTHTVSFSGRASQYSRIAGGVGPFGTFATHGSQHLESLSGADSTYFRLTFDSPVSAFGFYLTDVNNWIGTAGALGLRILVEQGDATNELELMELVSPSTVVNGNVMFFGLVDTALPFTGFSITNPIDNAGADALGLDQLMLPGTATVDSPATWTLLLAGLLPLAAARGRRPAASPAAGRSRG